MKTSITSKATTTWYLARKPKARVNPTRMSILSLLFCSHR